MLPADTISDLAKIAKRCGLPSNQTDDEARSGLN
jgi:hypothetical protein